MHKMVSVARICKIIKCSHVKIFVPSLMLLGLEGTSSEEATCQSPLEVWPLPLWELGLFFSSVPSHEINVLGQTAPSMVFHVVTG